MFNRLYIHVPFCIKKCHYCAFASDTPTKAELAEYPGLLIHELQLHQPGSRPIDSLYFGGGTPSLLHPDLVARLLENIAAVTKISSDAEITLEANPGTVDRASLEKFRTAGINRLSLGTQSFDDTFLAQLGRIHTADQSLRAFQDARNAGFTNLSIDLMHSLPGQDLHQWRSALQHAITLSPEHISIYGLTIEEGTPFSRMYSAESTERVDEDLSADMFELADELLTEAGYEHYEIANYARPGFRSQHNSGYWRRDGYLGLGVAAHSFLREGYGVRFSNPENLAEYRQMIIDSKLALCDRQLLSREEAMAEYMFLGLRLAEGVDQSSFECEFGQPLESVYGSAVADLAYLGLAVQNGNMLALTQRGMLLSNQACAKFL